mgnify:CR=1 FL=1
MSPQHIKLETDVPGTWKNALQTINKFCWWLLQSANKTVLGRDLNETGRALRRQNEGLAKTSVMVMILVPSLTVLIFVHSLVVLILGLSLSLFISGLSLMVLILALGLRVLIFVLNLMVLIFFSV